MKKVLIISYYFADMSEIGSVRLNGLANSLSKFGWEPFVLTSSTKVQSKSRVPIIEVPHDDATAKWKKILGLNTDKGIKEQLNLRAKKHRNDFADSCMYLWHELFAYPDIFANWRYQAVKYGDAAMACEGFDAIISSCFPWTCNLVAYDLKKLYDVPWIADFRDLWSQNHYNNHLAIRQYLEQRLESKTLSCADAITTVSQPLAEKMKEIHNDKEIFSIPNGFDENLKNPGVTLENKFTITYTGTLYKGRRDPEPLFQAISNLVSKGLMNPNDLCVEFYGPEEDWLGDDIRKYNLSDITNINGLISRDASIEKQRRSHLLLLLTWDKPDEKGVYTGKLFDYLAARRPIISIGVSGGVIEDLLKITGAGFHASNQDYLEQIVLDAYQEYKFKNNVSYHGVSSEIDKYTHLEMARKFSVILDSLTDAYDLQRK